MSLSIREPVGENELRKLLYDLGIPNIFDALSEWGIRDIFALQIGWFVGAGKVGFALVMLIFLVVILNQLTSITDKPDVADNQ